MELPTSHQFDNPGRWPLWDDDGSGEGPLDRETFDGPLDFNTFEGLHLDTFENYSLENLPADWPVPLHNYPVASKSQLDSNIRAPVPPALNVSTTQPMELSPSMESLPGLASPVSLYSNTTYTSPPMGWKDIHTPLASTMFPSLPLDVGLSHGTLIGMSQAFTSEMYTVLPNTNLQSSPTASQDTGQEAATSRELTMEDRPSGVSAREWRKIIRPEKCPVCGLGHTYPNERNKHIAARHREVAGQYGVPTTRPRCGWCARTFARGDHLTRHLSRSHSREAGRRKGGRGKKKKNEGRGRV
ncbi:uncharacterized protein C8A04DRAFT_26167 [Dichotomopilus funicola]|uniref:C2H2-type domain-containing protein n=1 Tax=Dichotomopilus funicola TaxID=1934379 RepID=A0AAN6V799_9PEZI|nr:hypothetical protein C8A04DRAFT_26167 [Dichotomopilus funicola]